MEEAESQSIVADSRPDLLAAKRPASEELHITHAKKIKILDDASVESADQAPAVRRIPIYEKVIKEFNCERELF